MMDIKNDLILRKQHVFLLDNVNVKNTIEHLFAELVLKPHEKERIENEVIEREQINQLLKILRVKPNSYQPFFEVQDIWIQDMLKNTEVTQEEIHQEMSSIREEIKNHLQGNFRYQENKTIGREKVLQSVSLHLLYKGIYLAPTVIDQEINVLINTIFPCVISKKKRPRNKERKEIYSNFEEKDSDGSSEDEVLSIQDLSLSSMDTYQLNQFLLQRAKNEKDQKCIQKLLELKIDGYVFENCDREDINEILEGFEKNEIISFNILRKNILPKFIQDKSTQQRENSIRQQCKYQNAYRETFREFQKNNVCGFSYKFHALLVRNSFHKSNLLDPAHFYLDCEDIVQCCNSMVKIICACLNERTNGTIHIGIREDEDKEKGLIKGSCFDKKVLYKTFLEFLRNMLFEDHIPLVIQCIGPLLCIDIIEGGVFRENHIFELDVIPHSKALEKETIYIQQESTERENLQLCILSEETFSPLCLSKQSEIRGFIKKKEDINSLRDRQEKYPLKAKQEDMNQKFLMLFTGGDIKLSQEIYPILFLDGLFSEVDKENFGFIESLRNVPIFDFSQQSCGQSIYDLLEKDNYVSELHFVCDFDPHSIENLSKRGRYEDILENMKKSIFPHWIFCNGHKSQNCKSLEVMEWKRANLCAFKEAIRFFTNELPQKRIVPMFFIFSKNYEVMLEAIDTVLQNFPDQWILFTDDDQKITYLKEEMQHRQTVKIKDFQNHSITDLPWSHINIMINGCLDYRKEKSFKVCSSKGVFIPFPESLKQRLCDLDILNAESCEDEARDMEQYQLEMKRKEVEEKYYKGGKPCWWNFWFKEDHVLKRKDHTKLMKIINDILDNQYQPYIDRKVTIVTLFHQPGAGGSTSALQVLWDFRKKLRCCVLKQIGNQTCNQLKTLRRFEENQPKPLLILADNIDEDTIDKLYDQLENEARIDERNFDEPASIFCILLNCTRCTHDPKSFSINTSIFLKHQLEIEELQWFSTKNYELEKSFDQKKGINPKLLISFNILKENFDTKCINRILKEFIDDLDDHSEQKLLLFLSFLNTYDTDCRPIPFSAFDNIMNDSVQTFCLRPNTSPRWDNNLSQAMNVLLNRSSYLYAQTANLNSLSIINGFVSKIIFSIMKEKLELNTSEVAEKLLCSQTFYNKNKSVVFLLNIFKDIIKRRINNVDGKKNEFSPLIMDVSEIEGIEVAINLVNYSFKSTNDPWIAQILARLYIKCENWTSAEEFSRLAINIRPDSSYLMDTLGQVFKKQITAQYKSRIEESHPIDVNLVCKNAMQAMDIFKKVQELNYNENQINDAGYFNEIKVAIQLLDCLKLSKLSCHLHELLVDINFTEQIPIFLDKNVLQFIRSLQNRTNTVLRKLEDIQSQLKDNNFTIKSRTVHGDLIKLRQNLDKYFGESTNTPPESYSDPQKADFRRRRIRYLGGNSVKAILCLRYEKPTQISLMIDIIQGNKPGSKLFNNFDTKTFISLAIAQNLIGKNPPSFKELVEMTKMLYTETVKSSSPIEDLECFLYIIMINWPTTSRKKFDIIPFEKFANIVLKWKDYFFRHYIHARPREGRAVRPYKETTLFYLGKENINSYNEIILSENLKDPKSGKHFRGDAIWYQKTTHDKLQRLNGILKDEGTNIIFKIDSTAGNKIELNISTAKEIYERSLWNKKVFFFLGFSWAGPKAFHVNLDEFQSSSSGNVPLEEKVTIHSSPKLEDDNEELEKLEQKMQKAKSEKEKGKIKASIKKILDRRLTFLE